MNYEEKKKYLNALQDKVLELQSEIEDAFQKARKIVGENEPAEYTCDFLLNNFISVDTLLSRFHIDKDV